MMNEKRMFKIFKKLVDVQEINRLSEHIIYPMGNNNYELYGTHVINNNNGEYVVNKLKTHTTKTFHNLRNAVIWVILDKTHNIVAANRIVELDIQYTSNLLQIQQQKRLLKSKNNETVSLAATKLEEQIYKNARIQEQIENYAIISNRWQNKQYDQLIKSAQ